jgi:uncharacterized membrane protein YkvA (DUF1232 family)
MFKRVALFWTLLRGEARVLWRALRHPDAPGWLKLGTAAIALYTLSPVDLLPDLIPFFGAVDDVLVITFGIRWLLSRLPPHIASAVR